MLESNPPRNSQPETHPDDERGCWPQGWRRHRVGRFPDALSADTIHSELVADRTKPKQALHGTVSIQYELKKAQP